MVEITYFGAIYVPKIIVKKSQFLCYLAFSRPMLLTQTFFGLRIWMRRWSTWRPKMICMYRCIDPERKHSPLSQVLIQYWSLLNWHNLRLRCGCVAVPLNWFFDIISSFFAKFKNVKTSTVHVYLDVDLTDPDHRNI